MSRINGTDLSKRGLMRLIPCLLGGVALASATGAAQLQPAAATATPKHTPTAPATYRVINLGAGELMYFPAINDSGQVAFSLNNDPAPTRALFYDGTTILDIGTLGGSQAVAGGVNNAGQVTGGALPSGDGRYGHGFVWSRSTGMIDLGALGTLGSSAIGINNRGQVAGNSPAPDGMAHAFRWSPEQGMVDIGLFPGGSYFTNATGISDSGLVTGWGINANGDGHAFAWTPPTGIIDLGTLGGTHSFAYDTNADGKVVGYATVPGNLLHAFIWSRSRGMKDLGTGGGVESFANAINDKGQVVGGINYSTEVQRAFSWTRASGMIDLGTLGGPGSGALDVNDKGQVVGGSNIKAGDNHAFVWTARHGMVDLNKRLRHAPAGLVVDFALRISDNGSIVAYSNAGLVLLKPDCGCKGTHTVGPIAVADMVEVGAPFDGTVSFAFADKAARHNVIWSWGDGSGDRAGHVRASNGAGSAMGRHTYTTPGIYSISATVTDLGGKSATVTRKIIAYHKAGGVVGASGRFMSPQGANRKERGQTGKAAFRFIAPLMTGAKATVAKAELQFHVGTLNFRSQDLKPVTVQGKRGQFAGSGTINGAGDYKFTLSMTAGAAVGQSEPGRFGLKIWHIDATTKAAVVDYDNQHAGSGSTAPAVQGEIILQN